MEFLFDDARIDQTAGVRRVLGLPRKEPAPVFPASAPWEAGGIHLRHALLFDREEDRFKLWYTARSSPDERGSRFLCYAESADGVSWNRPDLGLFSYAGDARNNILAPCGDADGVVWSVVKDAGDPDAARRYKALGYDYGARSAVPGIGAGEMGLCVAFSPDGLRWSSPTLIGAGRDLTDADCLFPGRDPSTNLWTGFFRPRTGPKRRFVGYATSDDFDRWTFPRMHLAPSPEDDEWTEFYGLTATSVADWRVGCLWVFHNNPAYSPMTTELVYSRDGRDYRRSMPRTEFLPLGCDGSFDSRMAIPVAMIERENEVLIYYRGTNREHGSDRGQSMPPGVVATGEEPRDGLGIARLPWGHFAGLHADVDGMIETGWVCNYGDDGVRAVAGVDSRGWLRAEILDQYGNPIPGWDRDASGVVPDERGILRAYWHEPHLVGSFGQASPAGGVVGHVVKVRFHLHRATLYGFQVGADSPMIPYDLPSDGAR